jgi:hypothetical protein
LLTKQEEFLFTVQALQWGRVQTRRTGRLFQWVQHDRVLPALKTVLFEQSLTPDWLDV